MALNGPSSTHERKDMKAKNAFITIVFSLAVTSSIAAPCTPIKTTQGSVQIRIDATSKSSLNAVWRCAMDHMKAISGAELEIHLGPGLYRLTEPLEVPTDWALKGVSVVIAGQDAVISGAKPIVQLSPYSLGSKDAGLLEAHLPAQLASLAAASVSREHGSVPVVAPINLLVNSQIRWRTEWPQNSYLSVNGATKSTGTISANVSDDVLLTNGMQVQGFFRYEWADANRQIEVTESTFSGQILHLALQGHWPKYGINIGGRFKLMNSPEHVTGTLGTAFIPARSSFVFQGPADESSVEYTDITELIKGESVSGITLRGLTFTGARGTAVVLRGQNISISNCSFRDNGLSALNIEGHDIQIDQSTFIRHGGTAVVLKGGDRTTLENSKIRFIRNEIRDFGNLVWSSNPALRIDGVGITVERNLIHDGPHAGIFFFGNDHLIRANEVHSIAKRTGDVGAIYTGRDWAGRGHHVVDNFVHHINGEGIHKATGIYLDDQVSGVYVANNLIVDAPRGVLLGGGRDNRIEGNHFAGVPICIRADARGEQWQANASGPSGELWQRLNTVPYNGEQWRSRFPELQDIASNKTGSPMRNIVQNNTGQNCTWDIDTSVRNLGSITRNNSVSRLNYRVNEGTAGPTGASRFDSPLFVIE